MATRNVKRTVALDPANGRAGSGGRRGDNETRSIHSAATQKAWNLSPSKPKGQKSPTPAQRQQLQNYQHQKPQALEKTIEVCCHERGPPGPLAYWKCTWDEKDLGIERDFELRGMEKRRLLRLRPDYKDEAGWKPQSRVEFMTIAAREALREGNCEIVGGFIRDWVIRGEVDTVHGTPKDIDLRLWVGFSMHNYVERCEDWGLIRENRDAKLGFRTPHGDWFFIDFVFSETFQNGNPLTIDLDVNSFAVSPDLGMHKRAYVKRPICKTYGNMRRKVAYLIKNNPPCDGHCDYMKKRVFKMESHGWKVIRKNSLQENCAKCAKRT